MAIIKGCYLETGEVIDPHTAIALKASLTMAQKSQGPIVSLACAHAAKFPDAVEKAIGIRPALPERLVDLHERTEFMQPMRNDLKKAQAYVMKNARITS